MRFLSQKQKPTQRTTPTYAKSAREQQTLCCQPVNPMPQTLNPKPQILNHKPQTSNLIPQTPNLKHQTSNPKTRNSKPQTPNPIFQTCGQHGKRKMTNPMLPSRCSCAPTFQTPIEQEYIYDIQAHFEHKVFILRPITDASL